MNGSTKLLSGAQTGADRAALDWAIFRDVPHGGWCPKGRKAEDGKIPPQYQLTETPSASYLQRTEWNVRDSDGTVIFTVAAGLAGGSKRRDRRPHPLTRPCVRTSCRHRLLFGAVLTIPFVFYARCSPSHLSERKWSFAQKLRLPGKGRRQ